jgi:hypothetical protein
MASSDYIDCLDCDLTPVEGSQYWVAPYVQDAFDQILRKYRPDLAELIKSNTKMELS